jgi:hypothetical protein
MRKHSDSKKKYKKARREKRTSQHAYLRVVYVPNFVVDVPHEDICNDMRRKAIDDLIEEIRGVGESIAAIPACSSRKRGEWKAETGKTREETLERRIKCQNDQENQNTTRTRQHMAQDPHPLSLILRILQLVRHEPQHAAHVGVGDLWAVCRTMSRTFVGK